MDVRDPADIRRFKDSVARPSMLRMRLELDAPSGRLPCQPTNIEPQTRQLQLGGERMPEVQLLRNGGVKPFEVGHRDLRQRHEHVVFGVAWRPHSDR
jgi:hypothetical protein